MRDKVILGVTLSIVLLLTLVLYGVVDTQRGPTTAAADRARAITSGKRIFAQYCIQCHGPLGEGCIGPALNRAVWRPLTPEGEANKDFDANGVHDFIKKTVSRGRASNQPGVQMPAWAVSEGGPLNDQDIEAVITFIESGNWNATLEDAASATGLNEVFPTYRGFDDAKVPQVKALMLSKGCLTCHTLGKSGGKIGADLTDVGSRRTADWLKRWIHDPKAMPAAQRGPNLWLVGPTVTVPVAGLTPLPNLTPTATPQIFPMNTTYMPTINMTDAELSLLVDYLSKARTSTK